MNKRTQYSAEYKAGIVLRVLREEETVSEIASKEGLNPVMISRWKAEFLERAKVVFDRGPTEAEKELAEEREQRGILERKVGQLTIENDWLKKNLRKLPSDTRKALVEKGECGSMSVRRQTKILDVPRSSQYPRAHKGITEVEAGLASDAGIEFVEIKPFFCSLRLLSSVALQAERLLDEEVRRRYKRG